ncbi:nicotinate phosphoribosyltransferase [Saccharicrinis carchari]|uniref:Nicotinate phosphoribosyltransferase n=1 Tax=Saccharicrinis carchari TaxID=1168039 RepID=A0A521DNM0_SACCC|nr:nicotinate phosphoribosyltransferase [Saccharicrinis carchari]SMO73283.1 nicotinate phosphoribosyltransferase [Saccharicrinis carchari]
MNRNTEHLGLFLDHYELSMAQGYFFTGRGNISCNFDYFFRTNPFESGFTIFAGLQDLLEMIGDFRFDKEAIDYLHKIGFKSDFLEFLKSFSFKGNIYAAREGEVVFSNEAVLCAQGTIIETQLLETLILNVLNFQSLIATKANRMRKSAGDRNLMEFGMRRAQGRAAIGGSRAAVIGGMDSTSNVMSAFLYGVNSSGTQAHSWVQSFDDELTAFRKFAETHPENCVLLVDTYQTLESGVPNAIIVAKEMQQRGQELAAIRLDSGDLAYISKKARAMLNAAGLKGVKIIASNRLDEYLINSLIQQGAPIDGFGVGTSLITAHPDAALDGVYKLSVINNKPTIKLSEDAAKVTLPGIKKIVRYFNSDKQFCADGIVLNEEKEEDIDSIYHPQFTDKKSCVKGLESETIVSKVYENETIINKKKTIAEISDYRKHRVAQLPEEFHRFEYPHVYKVGLSKGLIQLRNDLIQGVHK